MAIDGVITSQTGGRQFDGTNLTKYSMFVGGVNATNNALRQYSPLVNGYGRLFMVRPPYALLKIFAGGNDAYLYSSNSLFIQFKHMLEYMNRSVEGIASKTLEKASTTIQGGFAGRQFSVPTVTKEATQQFTVGLYEFVGCPVMTVIDAWMNAIGDENSGLATYGGYISGGQDSTKKEVPLYSTSSTTPTGIAFNEAEHTAEFIYVQHDRSGAQVERAIMLADCYPTSIDQGNVFNMGQGGTHDVVTYSIEFNCIAYRSPIITAIANDLLKQYRIVSNSLNFNPELGDAVYDASTTSSNTVFNSGLGEIPVDSVTGTNIGNIPVFNPSNTPKITHVSNYDVTAAKLAGSSGSGNISSVTSNYGAAAGFNATPNSRTVSSV